MEHLPWYLFSGVWLGWLFCVMAALLAGYLGWRRSASTTDQRRRLLSVGLVAAFGFGVCFGFLWKLGDFARSSSYELYDKNKHCYQDAWSGWLFLGSLSPLNQDRLLDYYDTQLGYHCEQTQARIEAWVYLQERQDRCEVSSRKLSGLGRFQEAITSGERCSNAESQQYVAYAHASLGDFTQAAKTLHKSVAAPYFAEVDISLALQAGDVALASSMIQRHLAWLEKTQRETDDPSHVLYRKGTPGYYPAKRRNFQCLLDAMAMRANDPGARARLEAVLPAEDIPDANNFSDPVCRMLLADQLQGQERLTLLASTPNNTSRLPCLLALEVDPEHACAAKLYQSSAMAFFSKEVIKPEIALVSSILKRAEEQAPTPQTARLRAKLGLELGIFEALVNHPEAAAKRLAQAERELAADSEAGLAARLAEGRALLALRTGVGLQEAVAALPMDGYSRPVFTFYANLREGRLAAPESREMSDLLGFEDLSIEDRQSLFDHLLAKDGVSLARWLSSRSVNRTVLLLLSLPEFDAAGKSAMREWFRWSRRGAALEHHLWVSLDAAFALGAHEVGIWESLGDPEEAKLRREATERYYQAYLTRGWAVPLSLLSGVSF